MYPKYCFLTVTYCYANNRWALWSWPQILYFLTSRYFNFFWKKSWSKEWNWPSIFWLHRLHGNDKSFCEIFPPQFLQWCIFLLFDLRLFSKIMKGIVKKCFFFIQTCFTSLKIFLKWFVLRAETWNYTFLSHTLKFPTPETRQSVV